MGTATAGNLRRAREQELRQRFVDAALALFGERGFDATTVTEIAAAANVSRRTFFRYFGRKEDVVLAWLDEVGAVLGKRMAERPPDEPPLVAARAAVLATVDDYRARAREALAAVALIERTPALRARERQMRAEWERELATQLAGRLGSGKAAARRARVFAAVAVAVFGTSISTWRSELGRPDLAQLVREAFDALEAGSA